MKFYRRKRFWISIIFLFPLLALFFYLALNPLLHFRKSVDFLLRLRGIQAERLQSGPYSIRYYEGGVGKKETVILLHGFGGDALLTWMRLMPALSKNYHVLAPNMLASNFLGLNPKTYSIDAEVKLVLRLMAAKNISHANLVGLSVGGWASLLLALEHPEKVDKLILVESAGLRTEVPELARLSLIDRPTARRFLGLLFFKPPPLPSFVLDELIKASLIIKDKYQAVFMGFIKNSESRLLDERLGELSQATLIIHGREDKVIPLEVALRLHQLIPHSELLILEESGHAPVWDQPQKLKEAILTFLSK